MGGEINWIYLKGITDKWQLLPLPLTLFDSNLSESGFL